MFAAIIIVYVLVKAVAYSVTGWVFFDRRSNDLWMKSFLFLLAMEGVCLFPIVMLRAYFELSVQTTLVSTAIVLGIFKLLALYKSYLIFFRNGGHSLQIFLYFCTLELMPLAMLIGALMLTTANLKVDY